MQISSQRKIVLADAQFLIIEALKIILKADFYIEEVVSTKEELFKILDKGNTDLLITDPVFSVDFGLNGLIQLKSRFADLPVLVLTNSVSKDQLLQIINTGINNIVYKTAGKEELLRALDLTLKGKKYFCEEVLDILLAPTETRPSNEKSTILTSSEIEIVKLIASGLTAKEIAVKKNLSIHTVNTHRKNIFRKTEVSNVSELIIMAIKAGWIDNIEYYI